MQNLFRRNIAITHEHGSWVFLLSPLLIGVFVGGQWSTALLYLIIAIFAGFLIRQPITIAVKIYTGRRHRKDLPAVWFWITIYALIGTLMVIGLILQGYGYLLYLAIPGIPVFIWHLWLVGRRAERRQAGIEILASGVLALSAPAAYWISVGSTNQLGWILWGLTWLQSAASIVYAYLRLEQRTWIEIPDKRTCFRFAKRANLYATFNLILSIFLALAGWIPIGVFLAYLLQWVETLWGTLNPAIGIKPSYIGIRQLIVSSLFTILFIVAWVMSS